MSTDPLRSTVLSDDCRSFMSTDHIRSVVFGDHIHSPISSDHIQPAVSSGDVQSTASCHPVQPILLPVSVAEMTVAEFSIEERDNEMNATVAAHGTCKYEDGHTDGVSGKILIIVCTARHGSVAIIVYVYR